MDEHPDSINDLTMFEQYRYYYEYYEKKFKRLALLFQIGDFYEMLGVDNETTKICNIKEMLGILPLALQDSSKPNYNTESNPLKAGFSKVAKSKYLSFLVDRHDYIVVQVDEVEKRNSTKSKNSKTRKVVAIHSPGTYINENGIDDAEQRYLVQIVVEGYKDSKYSPMSVGLSAIDIETGEMDFYEVYNNPEDENYAIDEIWRYLNVHGPKEVNIVYKNIKMDLESKIKHEICSQVNIIESSNDFDNVKVQAIFLEKVFNRPDVLNWLEISKFMTARLSLIMMLHYILNHNKILAKNLKKPTLWFSDKFLLLANNAIAQLNMVDDNRDKLSNVFNLVNFTSTNMGKRLLRNRILNPLKNVDEIKARYKLVEAFSDYGSYECFLKGMTDLEKLHRKLELGILSPAGLAILYDNYVKIQRLIEISPPLYEEGFPKRVKTCVKMIKRAVNLQLCQKFKSIEDINEPIFEDEYAPDLIKYTEIIRDSRREINNILENISSYIPNSQVTKKKWINSKPTFTFNKPMLALENDKFGYHFKITANRYKMLTEILTAHNIDLDIEELGQTPSKSHSYITTKRVKKLGIRLNKSTHDLKQSIGSTYTEFLSEMEKWSDTFKEMTKFVSQVDVYKSSAKCAKQYNYVKPKIKESEFGYIVAKNMRHPLVERICNNIYVPHDVNLGIDEKGLLIYGMNAAGKSVYKKAVGVCVIMAQAGLFVPADSFKFSPYNNILTRIIGNDDMQAGLSSFAVEMIELRGILARMGPKSLILGDELCKGTETVSGTAIVAEAIIEFIANKCSFVFSTHLHSLIDLEPIKKLEGLGVHHIKVRRQGRKLIYDRKIENGAGDSLYGLEVARAMGLPDEFINGANAIRKEILGITDSVLGKVSKYSSMVYLLKCGVCGNPSVATLETHHINEQENANEDGFIDHFHKNHPRNLVGLCKKCHKSHHKGKITISGWIETSDGFELKIEK